MNCKEKMWKWGTCKICSLVWLWLCLCLWDGFASRLFQGGCIRSGKTTTQASCLHVRMFACSLSSQSYLLFKTHSTAVCQIPASAIWKHILAYQYYQPFVKISHHYTQSRLISSRLKLTNQQSWIAHLHADLCSIEGFPSLLYFLVVSEKPSSMVLST